jgi:TPR repeat protein
MRLTLIALLLAGVVGCDPTPEEKFEATLKAAEQGLADAQFQLGYMYERGEGVPKDETESAKWYRKAAEQGVAMAQYRLGLKYRLGYGVPEDYAEAAKWCRKAAEQGFAGAQWMLGGIYVDGEGVPEDDIEGYAWFSVAATNGYAGTDKLLLRAIKADLTPEQLTAAEKRTAELLKQINANEAK